MTERPEDVYYGLILIQGTPPRLMAPKMPFADKRFFVLPLEARLERLFGNFTSAASALSSVLEGEFSR
ncbi:MAG: hypothetical protein DMG51_16735 [Acidobacteria bacterium]|nr:MAG: hypothetical protein DMG51_16735 [Acidobacteriota bacterium]